MLEDELAGPPVDGIETGPEGEERLAFTAAPEAIAKRLSIAIQI